MIYFCIIVCVTAATVTNNQTSRYSHIKLCFGEKQKLDKEQKKEIFFMLIFFKSTLTVLNVFNVNSVTFFSANSVELFKLPMGLFSNVLCCSRNICRYLFKVIFMHFGNMACDIS
ncbi:hypothetical protein BpHYR1_004169 [Brachionus plicatilis]|uniref:Uncharacterized protein n=1 Tax=Brachionus plicatilis TaxID=10195 RepID=A0A3M7R600_BRAPC|nr:hypothetical protein BpHYR1_004169 [Brachionus plicatilis]